MGRRGPAHRQGRASRYYQHMRRTPLVVLAVLVVGPVLAGHQALSEREAESMRQKLEAIMERASAEAAPSASPVTTSISEREVNAYLRFIAREDLPVGLVDPTITIAGGGRLGGKARIDLDAVRTSKARGSLDPLAYVSGLVELTLSGTLEASRGQGRFTLESATLSGVAIPQSLVQELVTYFTKTADKPRGVDLNRPFDLPAGIQQVRTGSGQATVVQ